MSIKSLEKAQKELANQIKRQREAIKNRSCASYKEQQKMKGVKAK